MIEVYINKINGKKISITATHYSIQSEEFLRVGKNGYAELLSQGFWIEIGVKNNHLLTSPRKYLLLSNKSKFKKWLCNLRLDFIGESFKII